MDKYHTALRDIKKIHFNSMNYHKSADPDLRNRGLLKILEIGAGSGNILNENDKDHITIINSL